jgi:acetylornithine deacetylase
MGADPTITLLEDLVSIDSVNPALVPGARGEGEVAGRIAAECIDAGMEVEIVEVTSGRPNVVAVIDGAAPGPALMFCGHMDTVGVAGMPQPFTPVHRNGRLYGRGAQDMKGGVAAMIGAAAQLAKEGLPSGRVIVAAIVDEEHASIGAEALVARWKADAAVVTEPTDLDVGIAHKGFEWIVVETRGRAAHGSRPQEGRDAILRMGRVLCRLEALNATLQTGRSHPLLGAASLHASTVSGGAEWSTYPGRCILQVERRTLPGESDGCGAFEAQEILRQLRAEDPELDADVRGVFSRSPYEIDGSSQLPGMMVQAAEAAGCRPRVTGFSFWSDTAILGSAGIPAVLFGPGGAGLHSTEEYVRVEEVLRCRDALAALARVFTRAS